MQNHKNLVNELRTLLSQKKSKEYYAKRLHISVAEVENLMAEIHNTKEDFSTTKRLNIEKGEIEIAGYWKTEPTVEQITKAHKIDTNEYVLSQYWSKQKEKGFQVSACFKKIKSTTEDFQLNVLDFFKTYKPSNNLVYGTKAYNPTYTDNCLIINTQDAHYNKYDTTGPNMMFDRFVKVQSKIEKIVNDAAVSTNLNKIIYIFGSDAFNSEFTGTTTHGTPQTNVADFYHSFEAVCEHEVSVINMLLASTIGDVEVLFIPGNHDEYVGWTLVKWLQAYFRNQTNLTINSDPSYTKYIKYGSSALAFNHGYKIKPEVLAQNFPMQFKEFSLCNHHYMFTGDKHTEHSRTIGGIKSYRLTQTSNAVSKWDDENGYSLKKAELTAFIIDEKDGMTRIYHEPIK